MVEFLKEKILTLGTAACPPYHLAIVIGGTSAEMNLKTVKLASTRYLDELPTSGNEDGHAFRDLEMEAEIHKLTQRPASAPSSAASISATMSASSACRATAPRCRSASASPARPTARRKGKITRDGIFLEQLETDPSKYMPEIDEESSPHVVKIDLNQPMPKF
jgi:fumarate hydratase class I